MKINGSMPVSHVQVLTETLEQNGVMIQDFKFNAENGEATLKVSKDELETFQKTKGKNIKKVGEDAVNKLAKVTGESKGKLSKLLDKVIEFVKRNDATLYVAGLFGGFITVTLGLGAAAYHLTGGDVGSTSGILMLIALVVIGVTSI